MKIYIKSLNIYGKINKIGCHCRPEDTRDIHDTLDRAFDDGFTAVYFYVEDLKLIATIRKAETAAHNWQMEQAQ